MTTSNLKTNLQGHIRETLIQWMRDDGLKIELMNEREWNIRIDEYYKRWMKSDGKMLVRVKR